MDDLLDGAPCGFLSFSDDGTIMLANATLLTMLGRARDAVLGRHVDTLLTVAGRVFYQTHVFPLMRLRGRIDEIYLALRTAAGESLPVLVNGVRRERNGAPCNDWIVVVMRERGRYEEALLQAKKAAEEAVRARDHAEQAALDLQKLESLSVLAGGIAHDFNNLLCSIVSNADLALLDLAPDDPARLSVTEIQHSALRAAELTAQMLAYSGRGRIVVGPLDLAALVQRMEALVRSAIARTTPIDYRIDAGQLTVDADASQIQQLIMNLMLNAAEALHGRDGGITVALGLRQLDQSAFRACYLSPDLPAGSYVMLEVGDAGHGMDAATQAKIFEPFFTTNIVGRGLGLAAVLGIVRAHGGAIQVISAAGAGTTVRVFLPQVS